MSTEVRSLAVYDRISDPMAAVRELGLAIAKSRMFGCENEEQGRVLAMTCFAKRVDPLALAERYHLIQGRLSMRADAMLAGLHERGGSHKVILRTDQGAEIEITVNGDTQRFSLTWKQAQEEPFVWSQTKGKLKQNWATPRSRMQMLWARVVSDGVRVMCPEVVSGIYSPEELSDLVSKPEAEEVPFRVEPANEESKRPLDSSAEYATGEQVQEIVDRYVDLGITHEQQEAALAKRGVKSLRSLTFDQAAQLLAKLDESARSRKDDQSKADPSARVAKNNEPATQAQIDKVKDLLRAMAQDGQKDIADRVRQKLESAGLHKLADLSMVEIDAMFELLKHRDIEHFFGLVLEGHAKN